MGAADWHKKTALELGRAIEAGTLDPRDLTEFFLTRIDGHSARDRIYMRLTPDRARKEADAAAARAKEGKRLSPLDGVPISWKDLFDSAGTATEAGSKLLAGRTPKQDAEALARATAAGLICLGKTSMTEFAYSGLGYNPTCGSPPNPFDPIAERVPGGSSGGAAVSVAEGLAAAAIGTDTGGSVRIPAAWNGLTGLKTTFGAVPLTGTVPLSPSLDTIGPLTKDVADAGALFAVLADRPYEAQTPTKPGALRLALAKNEILWDAVDDECWPVIDRALECMRTSDIHLPVLHVDAIDALAPIWSAGTVAWEAFQIWGAAIGDQPDLVYARVSERILPGEHITQESFQTAWLDLLQIRKAHMEATLELDAIVLPTVGFVPPEIASITASPEDYHRYNGKALFNTAIANQLGLCAISLPIGKTARTGTHGAMPVGLMLMAKPNDEARLLSAALTLEKIFKDLNAH